MKTRTTRKNIEATYSTIIDASYCNTLFVAEREDCLYARPDADVFTFGDIAIVTGFGSFGTITADPRTCALFDKRAWDICHDGTADIRTALRGLIAEFIEEVTA